MNDIVVGTTESYSSPQPAPGVGGSGRAYLIHANGTIAAGWPVKPTSINPNSVPLVAEGVGTSPVLANGDPTGTLAGGLTSLSIGGLTRTDVTARGRHLSLGGAAAGPFTAILRIGSLELSATGTLRPAGLRLVSP